MISPKLLATTALTGVLVGTGLVAILNNSSEQGEDGLASELFADQQTSPDGTPDAIATVNGSRASDNAQSGAGFSDEAACSAIFLGDTRPPGCGTGQPPADFVAGPFDGVWDVQALGNPQVAELTLVVSTGGGPFTRGAPIKGVWRHVSRDDFYGPNSTVGAPLRIEDDGTFLFSMGQFGFCNCRQIHFAVRPTGNPGVLMGEWRYEGESGTSIWHRRPGQAKIDTVSISRAIRNSDGEWVADEYEWNTRSGKISRESVTCGAGRSRMNCMKVFVTLLGENFLVEPLVWLDPATAIELRKTSWVCEDGSDQEGLWTGWDYRRQPGDSIVGIRMEHILWDGMKSGPVTIWVNGQPVPIDVTVEDQPRDETLPGLQSLTVLDEWTQVTSSMTEEQPVRIEALFEYDHPDAWVSLDLESTTPGEGGANSARKIILVREPGNHRLFYSNWLSLKDSNGI